MVQWSRREQGCHLLAEGGNIDQPAVASISVWVQGRAEFTTD